MIKYLKTFNNISKTSKALRLLYGVGVSKDHLVNEKVFTESEVILNDGKNLVLKLNGLIKNLVAITNEILEAKLNILDGNLTQANENIQKSKKYLSIINSKERSFVNPLIIECLDIEIQVNDLVEEMDIHLERLTSGTGKYFINETDDGNTVYYKKIYEIEGDEPIGCLYFNSLKEVSETKYTNELILQGFLDKRIITHEYSEQIRILKNKLEDLITKLSKNLKDKNNKDLLSPLTLYKKMLELDVILSFYKPTVASSDINYTNMDKDNIARLHYLNATLNKDTIIELKGSFLPKKNIKNNILFNSLAIESLQSINSSSLYMFFNNSTDEINKKVIEELNKQQDKKPTL